MYLAALVGCKLQGLFLGGCVISFFLSELSNRKLQTVALLTKSSFGVCIVSDQTQNQR